MIVKALIWIYLEFQVVQCARLRLSLKERGLNRRKESFMMIAGEDSLGFGSRNASAAFQLLEINSRRAKVLGPNECRSIDLGIEHRTETGSNLKD